MRSRQFARAADFFEKASVLAPRAGSLYNAAALVHFTQGGPWFDAYQQVEYADEWLAEKELMNSSVRR